MTLSEYDKQCIKKVSYENPVHQYLKYVAIAKYKVGQVLIKKVRDVDQWGDAQSDWRNVRVFPKSGLPRKFKVVYIDEQDIPFVKQIKVSGQLGDIVSLAAIDYRRNRFEIDPDYVDHMILGGNMEDFDPLRAYKGSKIAPK